MLPMGVRFFTNYMRNYGRRNKLAINIFAPMNAHPVYGVPCGALGAGSIGRDYRGGFCKFSSVRPGIVEQAVTFIDANQFIVTVRRGQKTVLQKVSCIQTHACVCYLRAGVVRAATSSTVRRAQCMGLWRAKGAYQLCWIVSASMDCLRFSRGGSTTHLRASVACLAKQLQSA
jgi:hypothetical protein